MKASFHPFLLALGLALPGTALAQNELSNFSATGRGGVINTFATDYQVIGINPANLGRSTDFKVAFTIGEIGAGVGSQSLTKTMFKHILYDGKQSLTPADRTLLVQQLTGDNVLNLNVDATTLGLAITLPNGLGGIAFSNRQRVAGHLALNGNAADIIVNGQNAAVIKQYYPTPNTSGTPTPTNPSAPNVSAVLDGTSIQAAWTSEYNISYGVQVLDKTGFKLSAGVGYRYIQGIGISDVRVSGGTLYAYNALSPLFNVNYGNLATSPSFNLESGSGLSPVGKGNGFDFGLAAEIGKMVRVGASVTDIGSMTWTGNVLQATDQKLQQTSSSGLETYDVFTEISKQFDQNAQSLFTYEAAKERKAALPAKLRLGGGVRISQFFEAGLDVTMPLNKVAGNLTAPFVGVGVDYKPLHWLKLSSGFTGGAGYGKSLPLGLTFVTPVWEAGISTRDVVGLLSEESPYSSVAFGLLRFKFGGE
ncbi:DUF5723 family protein [Hymenobacter ruricola]|uniref:DUF5723 domain-containing protein n=1 Tax=Hymenobacter ruricola TaxID=2791023 RepID=A0ABS0HZ24_9BACT|nr:DUF5723 family protein [Hymenobacter ruricola]MBF9219957.1 hypothetical protein [Hymenobacter ruricola]